MIIRLDEEHSHQLLSDVAEGDYSALFRLSRLPVTPLHLAELGHTGLLSKVIVLQGSSGGGFAIKSLPEEPGAFLEELLAASIFANEAAFFEWVGDGVRNLPKVYALGDQVLVLQRYDASDDLDQNRGLGVQEARMVSGSLGELHRQLADANQRRRFEPTGHPWSQSLGLVEKNWPIFREELLKEDQHAWDWLPTKGVDRLIGRLLAWTEENSWTVCSYDMRTGNILGTVSAPRFIDWQFADHGPGAFDLASLIGTSMRPAASNVVEDLLVEYAVRSGHPLERCRAEFSVGILARALFTVVVAVDLPHPNEQSVRARSNAIERLSLLLRDYAQEGLQCIGS